MDRDKVSPAAAALHGEARLINIFRGLNTGKALPFSSSAPSRVSGLPGGMRTEDGRVWVVISRPEDSRSSFPQNEWITADMLRSMAESYDAERVHRAPVVLPQGGPAHWTGEFSRETAGDIDGLEFDGLHLWGLVNERDGRVTQAVNDGLGNRSIRWWPELPAAGGKPYLRHLAVMAEPAGTENLGLLDHFFTSEQKGKGRSAAEIDSFSQLATCERSLAEIPTIDAASVQAAKESKMAKETEGDDVRPLVIEEVARAMAAVQKPTQTQPVQVTPEAIAEAVMAAIGDQLTKAREQSQAVAEELRVAREASKKVEIARGLEQLVREHRLSPQMRTELEPLLGGLDEAALKVKFESFAKLPAQIPSRSIAHIEDPETGQPMEVPAHLSAPPETGLGVADPVALKIEAAAHAAAEKESDPTKQRAVYERELIKGFGGKADSQTLPFLN